jgi:hypothetical protein
MANVAELRPGKKKETRERQADALEKIARLLGQLVAKTNIQGTKTSRK